MQTQRGLHRPGKAPQQIFLRVLDLDCQGGGNKGPAQININLIYSPAWRSFLSGLQFTFMAPLDLHSKSYDC